MLRTAMMVVAAVLTAEGSRETVLDRKPHLYEEMVENVPDVPPLCDSLEGAQRKVDIGGCGLYCEEEGQGTPIVLLHGGPGATHHGFHPEFSQAAQFARVIYYDQRGCGQSDYAAGDGYSVAQAVEDLDKLREALGIDRWVVLGHSYGGTLAQCYAVKHPDRVMGLVLVGSATYGLPVGGSGRGREYITAEEQDRVAECHSDGRLSQEARLFNAHRNGDWKRQNFYRPTDEDLARMTRYEWKHDRLFRSTIGPTLDEVNLEHCFDECPLPILLMEGRWDLTWDEGKPERLRKCMGNAALKVYERAGHSPFEDEPEAFFADLKGFIDGLPEAAPDGVSAWRERVAELERKAAESPVALLKRAGWGVKSNETIATAYKPEWIGELEHPGLLLKLGFALYDAERYEEALEVFRAVQEKAGRDTTWTAVGAVWQGHMLDLLGRREEAVGVYREVVKMDAWDEMRHDQYGLAYAPSGWAEERIEKPFEGVKNRAEE